MSNVLGTTSMERNLKHNAAVNGLLYMSKDTLGLRELILRLTLTKASSKASRRRSSLPSNILIDVTMTHLIKRPRIVSVQLVIVSAFALIILSPTALPLHVCSGPSDAIRYSSVFFDPQTDDPIFRLFRLEGSSSREVAAKVKSVDKPSSPGFSLVSARLENDGIGVAARIRTMVTIANQDSARRITEVEWRLDIFDASLGNRTNQITQSAKINIYSGETANASARFGAVLPDRMIILLQLARVAFDSGQAWSPSGQCSLETDLATVSCQSK